MLRLLRRRSLAALRHEVEPVAQPDLARFLPQWQGVGGGLRGREGLLRAVEQLTGAVVPASALESLVLPARVADYRPALLDEVMSSGEVVWRGHGSLPGDDGWVSLHLADAAHLTLTPPEVVDAHRRRAGRARRARGRRRLLLPRARRRASASATPSSTTRSGRCCGRAASPTTPSRRCAPCSPVAAPPTSARRPARGRRGMPAGAVRSAASARCAVPSPARAPPRSRPPRTRRRRKALAAGRAVGSGPSTGVGRWTALPPAESDPTVRAVTNAELLLDRYGVLTRGSVVTEDVPGGFAAVYRVLAAAEEAGKVRRGYFVEGLGASQFASTGAVDRLRSMSRLPGGDDRGAGRRVDAADGDEWLAPSPAAAGGVRHGAASAVASAPGRRRSSSPRATPPTPTAPPSGGPSAGSPTPQPTSRPRRRTATTRRPRRPPAARATSRAARRGPSSCSSTASSCSTSSAGGKTMLCWSDDPGAPPGRGRRARARRA